MEARCAVRRFCLSCSVFRQEISRVIQASGQEMSLDFFDSALHKEPEKLLATIQQKIREMAGRADRTILVCGDCHPRLLDWCRETGVVRTPGMNCAEILLGKELRRQLLREGAFFLLPEWTTRWREILTDLLGLPPEGIPKIFQQNHRKLVYLDTGVLPIPEADLQACADWCGLPWEVLKVGLEHFRLTILQACGAEEKVNG